MKDKKSVTLVAVSVLGSLLIAEAALRLFEPYGEGSPEAGPVTRTQPDPGREGSVRAAMRHIDKLAAAEGTRREWFLEDPPPLPNRKPVPPEMTERYEEFIRRKLYPPQAQYIWNRHFVRERSCQKGGGFFDNHLETMLVFDPPSGRPYPRFRFLPGATLPSGLVTNQFGLRGPPLDLRKPRSAIRIAFVGASTTVNPHQFAYSYPEYTVHWLNVWAAARGHDVRFEVLNAGREGIGSEDISAIVREELVPLEPDLVVYYEGSNQFTSASLMVSPRIPPRQDIPLPDDHKIPKFARWLATGRLLDRALMNRFAGIGEPRKPSYRLVWPDGVNEHAPDVDHPNLPVELSVIRKNLDEIREALQQGGGKLVLCSFVWLAEDGMRFPSALAHQHIYRQLNTVLWPLRYADIRGLADFQNRVLRKYAESRGAAFLDVASHMPKEFDLYVDAIHMTETGERVKAWVVFQQLVPMVEAEIAAGRLPQEPRLQDPQFPSIEPAEMRVPCLAEKAN